MIDFSEGTINCNRIKIHYYRTGSVKPSMVMLHGMTDDGMCWIRAANALSEKFDVIMPDARGHGKSDDPDEGYFYDVFTADVMKLMEELKLIKPVIVGHSMGAITALVLAGLYPEVPGAVVLEDPPPFWSSNPLLSDTKDSKGLEVWIKSNKRKTYDDFLSEINPKWHQEEVLPWINSKHRYSMKILNLLKPETLIQLDLQDICKKIQSPVLFLSADIELGAASDTNDVERIQELIPHIQVKHFTGAGHNIRRDMFEDYLAVVKDFLYERF